MKLLSLFSGIGAFEKALNRLQINYELVAYCEIDKYASKSYAAIHGVPESMNLGDITKVDEKSLPKDIDLITYGFPCQDISLAGKQKGLFNEDGSQTRSGLFFEALRIIEETKPVVTIAENVKNLTGKKFKDQFKIVLDSLESAGYNNYWKVLNAKDFGVPQNRERVFIVSIRKDADTGAYKFPEGFPLRIRLKDLLENEVDEKFYINNERVSKLLGSIPVEDAVVGGMQKNQAVKSDGVCTCLTSSMGAGGGYVPMVKQIGNVCPTKTRDNPNQGRVYDPDFMAPTLNCMGGGNLQPCVAVAMRGRYAHDGQVQQNIEVPDREYANAITTVQKDSLIAEPSLRIRKLTPKECFRLMDFEDVDFDKAAAVNSNSQLYKQAGNSIVVACPYYIIKALIEANILIDKEKKEMELKMNEFQLPGQILFNYEELKQELTEKVSYYENLVYTDEQIKEAKADKATLNKLKKSLNDERIRMEREYMEPFNDFKSKLNEIISIIEKPIAAIDLHVKAYDDKQKQDKKDQIMALWDEMEKPAELKFDLVFEERMLNTSFNMKHVKTCFTDAIDKFNRDVKTLEELPEFGFEAKHVYFKTLDINLALAEGQRMAQIQKKKQEAEAEKARLKAEAEAKAAAAALENSMNPPVSEEAAQPDHEPENVDAVPKSETVQKAPAQWVKFQALLTTEDALALRDFFDDRNIEFKPI